MKQPLAARIEKLGGQHLHQTPWTFKQLRKDGQACRNCGHVFTLPKLNDDGGDKN